MTAPVGYGTKETTSMDPVTLSALISGGAGLLNNVLGAKNQADIAGANRAFSLEQLKYQKEKDALDQAYRNRALNIEESLKLKELAQSGQISQRDYELRLKQLENEQANNEAVLEQRKAEMLQSGKISEQELAQREMEFSGTQALREKELAQTGSLQGRAMAETERLNKAREQAYSNALKTGKGMADTASTAFLSSVDTANPELEQMEKDILSGQSESLQRGAGQLGAELTKGGVRGGQYATQMRRGIGEMTSEATKNLNRMKYEEAQNRQAQKLAYLQAMANAGRGAMLNAPAF